MGRTDVRTLNVPEPPRMLPEVADTAANPDQAEAAWQALKLEPSADRVNMAPATVENKTVVTHCPSCRAGLSGVEQKFERCLSCGTAFSQSGSARPINVGL